MPKFASLVDRVSGKGADAWATHFLANEDKTKGKDVIIMSIGDPDFSTPEPIVESAVQALRNGDTHYAEIPGIMPLREAVANEVMRVSGSSKYQVNAFNVMVMAGTQNALFGAAMCLLEPGDEIIALDPMYVTYDATWSSSGAKIVRVATPRETGFRLVPEDIEKAITARTKAIVFANPNNPTGIVMSRKELEAIADIAKRYDLWVISDEVYAAQTFEKPHYSIAALPDMKERTVTCGSLSKSHAMTGWRIGWLVGPKELIRHCDHLGLAMLYGLAGFIQTAAIEALTGSIGEVEKMLEIYRSRCDLVAKQLKNVPNIDLIIPEAGMFILIDVSKTGKSAGEFAKALYAAEKVSTLDGAAFGEPTANCIRISFTSGKDQLEEGCKRIERFVRSLG